jgi:hypothetical protein
LQQLQAQLVEQQQFHPSALEQRYDKHAGWVVMFIVGANYAHAAVDAGYAVQACATYAAGCSGVS